MTVFQNIYLYERVKIEQKHNCRSNESLDFPSQHLPLSHSHESIWGPGSFQDLGEQCGNNWVSHQETIHALLRLQYSFQNSPPPAPYTEFLWSFSLFQHFSNIHMTLYITLTTAMIIKIIILFITALIEHFPHK